MKFKLVVFKLVVYCYTDNLSVYGPKYYSIWRTYYVRPNMYQHLVATCYSFKSDKDALWKK